MKSGLGLVAVVSAATVLMAGSALARTSTYESRGQDTCFVSTYVPNLVEENTRGRLFRGPHGFVNSTVGGRVNGGVVRSGVEPAQYIKTERVVEREHYTLSPAPCP
jgi:hypothetical protein